MDHLKRTLDKICPLGWKTAPYPNHQKGMLFYGAFEVETSHDLSEPLATVIIDVWSYGTAKDRWTVKIMSTPAMYDTIQYIAHSNDCEGRLLEAIQAFARLNEWPPVRFQVED